MNWYQFDVSGVTERLTVDPARGLNGDEAARRLEPYGSNGLADRGGRRATAILRERLTDTMVLVLIAAAGISASIGELDALVIAAIVALNTALGFTQEFPAERAIRALQQLAVPCVRVRRDGRVLEILAQTLVPGDVRLLECGAPAVRARRSRRRSGEVAASLASSPWNAPGLTSIRFPPAMARCDGDGSPARCDVPRNISRLREKVRVTRFGSAIAT